MGKVELIHPDGTEEVLDVPDGESVMRAAVNGVVDSIVGECGGQLMCATCHVYVDEPALDGLPPISEDEDAMLDTTACERRPTSRLSCQLVMGPALDGLRVSLPESQL